MRIEDYVHTTKEEVEGRRHNIWIGISLGNKYFTKEHTQKYIEWALQYTREKVLVVIADYIHAINLQVFDRRSPDAALRKALKMGEKKYKEIQELIQILPENQQKKSPLFGGKTRFFTLPIRRISVFSKKNTAVIWDFITLFST